MFCLLKEWPFMHSLHIPFSTILQNLRLESMLTVVDNLEMPPWFIVFPTQSPFWTLCPAKQHTPFSGTTPVAQLRHQPLLISMLPQLSLTLRESLQLCCHLSQYRVTFFRSLSMSRVNFLSGSLRSVFLPTSVVGLVAGREGES